MGFHFLIFWPQLITNCVYVYQPPTFSSKNLNLCFTNSGDRDTGLCPRNYVSGTYGLGYCYNAWTTQSKSFGEAALACAAVDTSHLLDISSAEEDTFLADYIIPMFRGK